MAVKVVIAEDSKLYRAILHRILSRTAHSMEVVGEAGDGASAVEMVETLNPDLLLLDVNLPDMDGFSVLEEVRHRRPAIKILMLTMYSGLIYSRQALAKGANGYCTKDAHFGEIVAAIDAVLDGKTYLSPEASPPQSFSS